MMRDPIAGRQRQGEVRQRASSSCSLLDPVMKKEMFLSPVVRPVGVA